MSCCGNSAGQGPRMVVANDAATANRHCSNRISNTKYTPANFLFKNLAEQFSRPMNQYFLFIAVLQLWGDITPVNPATTWGPLIIIFAITAIKEAIDDLHRRRSDKLANTRAVRRIVLGAEERIQAQELRVGNIVKLVENDEVPCDMVMLSCSDEQGACYVQTTNLDGESNLKPRTCLRQTQQLATVPQLCDFKGAFNCPEPDGRLDQFDAQLRIKAHDAEVISVGTSQLLLQATHIRNTDWVYGVVVYTGNETKFGNNKSIPAPKLTKTDKVINVFSRNIFLFQLGLVIIFGIIGNIWEANTGEGLWYLHYRDMPAYQIVIIPLRFLLLNSTMIPISLKVTLDLCKLYYARFVERDAALYDVATNTPAGANSTALGEDLGQVQYVLSDKTGTLTENVMAVKCCTIGGIQFGDAGGDSLTTADDMHPFDSTASEPVASPSSAASHGAGVGAGAGAGAVLPSGKAAHAARKSRRASLEERASRVLLRDARLTQRIAAGEAQPVDFMRCLALNNSVTPVLEQGHRLPRYKASSPDEEALVLAAAQYSAVLVSRETTNLKITVNGAEELYEQLHEMEFHSARKRMSVLVRNKATRQLRLFVKGADDVVIPHCKSGQKELKTVVQQIEAFAACGLRTLVLAYRDLSEQEYAAWYGNHFHAANTAMQNREQLKWKAYALMEQELTLLGATAIEDKLQQQVPASILEIKQAGCRFWMLTGDKPSTALMIAKTCNLMPSGNLLRMVEGKTDAEVGRAISKHLEELVSVGSIRQTHNSRRELDDVVAIEMAGRGDGGDSVRMSGRFTLMAKGEALHIALTRYKDAFADLIMAADSAICCRVSPQQKADLVALVKERGKLTLAIGDGGNDVAMIQTAHVGIGIKGKEGLEAARAADYVLPQFKGLRRLMLLHGRWAYYRTALVAQYSFYKSLAFCFTQIFYTFYSGFAGTSVFNSLCVAAYNAILFVPIVFFFLDKDVSERTIAQYPSSYQLGAQSLRMNWKTMTWWTVRALYQGAVLLLATVATVPTTPTAGYETIGLSIFSSYLWLQSLTMVIELRRITVKNLLTIFGLHLFAVAAAYGMQLFTSAGSFIDYKSLSVVLADPAAWLTQLLVVAACIAPVEAVKAYMRFFHPDAEQLLSQRDIALNNRRRTCWLVHGRERGLIVPQVATL